MGVACSVWHQSPEEQLEWAQIPNALGRGILVVPCHGLDAPGKIFLQ